MMRGVSLYSVLLIVVFLNPLAFADAALQTEVNSQASKNALIEFYKAPDEDTSVCQSCNPVDVSVITLKHGADIIDNTGKAKVVFLGTAVFDYGFKSGGKFRIEKGTYSVGGIFDLEKKRLFPLFLGEVSPEIEVRFISLNKKSPKAVFFEGACRTDCDYQKKAFLFRYNSKSGKWDKILSQLTFNRILLDGGGGSESTFEESTIVWEQDRHGVAQLKIKTVREGRRQQEEDDGGIEDTEIHDEFEKVYSWPE